jgi:hypothetical protein
MKTNKIVGGMFEIWTGSPVNESNNRHVRQCQVVLSSSFVYNIFVMFIIKRNTFHSQKWLFKATLQANRHPKHALLPCLAPANSSREAEVTEYQF